ncbi:cupin domain-containing protein [Cupriavidus sp.]|uniref:cupin domain-containing protein n=1 Tax=Cupriavidus sp. TaxID=1873897 RepID=UPI0031D7C385
MRRVLSIVAMLAASCALLAPPAVAAAPEVKVTPLTTEPLPEYPGKEVQMIMVEYPPGGYDPVHRHDAHGFIYVLEGTIIMGVKGGKEVTLKPGQTFHEGPNDIHTVGRNASTTKPARFIVFLIKNQGAPILTPVK